jgi:hypothetical protein
VSVTPRVPKLRGYQGLWPFRLTRLQGEVPGSAADTVVRLESRAFFCLWETRLGHSNYWDVLSGSCVTADFKLVVAVGQLVDELTSIVSAKDSARDNFHEATLLS